MTTTKMNFDVARKTIPQTLLLKQGDRDTRTLEGTIYGNGVIIDGDSKKAAIYIERPDKEPFYNKITGGIVDGKFTYTFTSDDLAVAGTGYAEIRIMDDDETEVLSTIPFVLQIEKSVYDDDALLSTNNGTKLQQYVDDVTKAKNASEKAAQKAESAADRAEAAKSELENANIEMSGVVYALTQRDGKWYDRQGICYTLDVNAKTAKVGWNDPDSLREKDNASEYSGANGGVVVIPEIVCANDVYYQVVDMLPYAFSGNFIKSIDIKAKLVVLDKAFISCFELEFVELPDTLNTICSYSFSDCLKLKTLHIPHDIKKIETYALGSFVGSDYEISTILYIDNYSGVVEVGDQGSNYIGQVVYLHDIPDGFVTPAKTNFAAEGNTVGALIGTMDIEDTLYGRVSVEHGKNYLICPDGCSDTPPSSVMLEIINGESTVIEQTPIVELPTISTVDATISGGRLVTTPAGASKMYLTTIANDTGIKYKVYPVAQHLLIPTLMVGGDQIGDLPDGVVTMPKLSAEVREALSGALRRKVVTTLPSADGQLLVARKADFSSESKTKDGDVVSTYWVPLDSSADVTPIANTKRLRFTLTLHKASGNGSYRGGQVRLRKWKNATETVATYGLPSEHIADGAVDWDIPLTDFNAASAGVWTGINEIMVYVYANNSTTPADGEYSITISNVRIVDTAVQSELDLQTIYMVPSDDPQSGNVYDEYMYIGGAWERIGSTEVDLSGYLKLDDANMELSGIHVLTKKNGKWYDRQGIKYTLDTTRKVATIGNGTTDTDNAGYTGANDGMVIIPAKVCADGVIYRVEIGFYSFYGNTHIKRLILSEGLTGDGSVSFQNCTALSEICFPSSITAISDYNFGYCPLLHSVHIPSTITTINNDAFENCADGFTLYIDNYDDAVSIGTNNGTAVYLRANPADVKAAKTTIAALEARVAALEAATESEGV